MILQEPLVLTVGVRNESNRVAEETVQIGLPGIAKVKFSSPNFDESCLRVKKEIWNDMYRTLDSVGHNRCFCSSRRE